ncbi:MULTISPECIES: 30S ribosomal protein S6 [Lachnoanaerobaculum]|jgi:ribosomal protein S6|uniref:Small ribosomal subunit protein bS6 n=2 Tax=Lachnoanaerobaculum TaxID=1164882 RepID=A0A133ZB24_9FIRM|nr:MULTISPECIES: 30S ribosomal protein S6 [Lachnoanaerobaculum]EHO49466.1 ribosomal protein S6 [Lachnospiraceae bacterium oral taxon 082 str. F0431]MBS6728355.1 30S ribosomal protein S6 [Lachnospiraceae bacterium oral taxon 082]MDU5596911.1 30S ribosomal protein S6 [Lachnospiraceae bacterium]KXB52635.1 ribosomal protein S6 [Lachnoanaerobaculum saburreum]MBS6929563.1 30S ribosomal protein S6 [Lachnospiraceae bacterium oral taxon 082]
MTSTYELALVLNGKLEDDARAEALEKVQNYITRFGGSVLNVDDWGKKKFAYDINKQKEGFYYFIKFQSEDNNCPNELEANVRIMEPVVRYLVVKQ